MAIVSSTRKSTTGGGGGTGEQQRYRRDTLNQTEAWAAGALSIPLTSAPVDNDAIIVWSQGMVLHPNDYAVLTGPNRVQINFAADPATDTDTGTWSFFVQYPYLI